MSKSAVISSVVGGAATVMTELLDVVVLPDMEPHAGPKTSLTVTSDAPSPFGSTLAEIWNPVRQQCGYRVSLEHAGNGLICDRCDVACQLAEGAGHRHDSAGRNGVEVAAVCAEEGSSLAIGRAGKHLT